MADEDDTKTQTDKIIREMYMSDDVDTAGMGLEMLTEADHICHMRIQATAAIAGEDSPNMALELTTHVAVAHLRLRVKAHVDKLRRGIRKKSKNEEHADLVASIKLLYLAEDPEYLESNDVHEPLSDGHAMLLASWLLGEGWTRSE